VDFLILNKSKNDCKNPELDSELSSFKGSKKVKQCGEASIAAFIFKSNFSSYWIQMKMLINIFRPIISGRLLCKNVRVPTVSRKANNKVIF